MDLVLNIVTEKGTISMPVHFNSNEPIDYEEYYSTFGVVTIEQHVEGELIKALRNDDFYLTQR